MIALDAVTLTVRENQAQRALLDRASFRFTPGIWHIAADPPGDARHLVQFLATCREPAAHGIRCDGPRSWPLAQFAPFGPYLTGIDIIDAMSSLYALERRGTVRLFQYLIDDADWLLARFDRWPPVLQRQFGHIAFLAPAFENYFLDISPIFPDDAFQRRWQPLFHERIAGKTVIIASGQHRATLRDFPGQTLALSGATLRGTGATVPPPALAAE
ncbi:MAG TPA: hypothetical protein VH020_03720 [Stellaceae bacterium]|jgi:hypothetical protein|nr:hypothetical protein [Stellaceae bacterium]